MPPTPDPDPLSRVIGVLRTAVDELARLAEHPTVKNLLDGVIGALSRDDPPDDSAHPGPRRAEDPASTTVKSPPRRRSGAHATTPAPGGSTPKHSATSRREHLLATIEQNPGTSIAAAARKLDVSPGGLYRVARKLEADGLIRKEGTGWHAAS